MSAWEMVIVVYGRVMQDCREQQKGRGGSSDVNIQVLRFNLSVRMDESAGQLMSHVSFITQHLMIFK